jgi:hypothetical protein
VAQHRGYRLFIAGCAILVLTGLAHSLAIVQSFGEPQTAQEAAYREAARAFGQQVGRLNVNAWGGIQTLNLSYCLLVIYAGLLNVFVSRRMVDRGVLRRLTVANVILSGSLTVFAIVFQFPPPGVLTGLAFALFTLSLWAQRPAAY